MKGKFSRLIVPILGIILGIVTIVTTFVSYDFNYSFNGTVSNSSYGGDAYTGIQNASAKTANNVYNTYELVQNCFRILFIIIGALIILYYLGKLLENIRVSKIENSKD